MEQKNKQLLGENGKYEDDLRTKCETVEQFAKK